MGILPEHCEYGWCSHRPKGASDSLGLELQMAVTHHAGAGNQPQALWKAVSVLTTVPSFQLQRTALYLDWLYEYVFILGKNSLHCQNKARLTQVSILSCLLISLLYAMIKVKEAGAYSS